LVPSIGVFFARTRFRLRRSENENDDDDDDENDFRNEGERGALALIGIPASRLLRRALGFARFSRSKAGRLAAWLTLERVALAPRQSFLNIVLVGVLVLVFDFRDPSDKPSRLVVWFHRLRFSSPARVFGCGGQKTRTTRRTTTRTILGTRAREERFR
jgi:hypothetical protein